MTPTWVFWHQRWVTGELFLGIYGEELEVSLALRPSMKNSTDQRAVNGEEYKSSQRETEESQVRSIAPLGMTKVEGDLCFVSYVCCCCCVRP